MKNRLLRKKISMHVITCISFLSNTLLYSDAPPLPPMFGSTGAPSDALSLGKTTKPAKTVSTTPIVKPTSINQNVPSKPVASKPSTSATVSTPSFSVNSSSSSSSSSSGFGSGPAPSDGAATPAFGTTATVNSVTPDNNVPVSSHTTSSMPASSSVTSSAPVSSDATSSVLSTPSYSSASSYSNDDSSVSSASVAPTTGFTSSSSSSDVSTASASSSMMSSDKNIPSSAYHPEQKVSEKMGSAQVLTTKNAPKKEDTPSEISHDVRPSLSVTPAIENTNHTEGKKVISSGVGFADVDEQAEKNDDLVDTFNITTGGNWVLKRVWWEKTETMYEKIKDVFNKVMDSRTQFVKKRNDLDRELDIFYGEMGVDQGPLQNLIHQAQNLMDKEKKEQGYLDKKERAFVAKLAGKERTLEQLKLDIKGIQELDHKIDEALDTLFQQIDTCNDYEQKAWENFKEIARELDDKQARVLYYHTETLHKDCLKIQTYINTPFTSYFDEIVESAKEHMQKVAQQMNGLKKEGVDLVKESHELEKDEVKPEHTSTEKKEKSTSKKTWYTRIFDDIHYVWNSAIDTIKNLFHNPKKELDVVKKETIHAYDQAQQDIKDEMRKAEEYVDYAKNSSSSSIKKSQNDEHKGHENHKEHHSYEKVPSIHHQNKKLKLAQ